MIELCSLRRKGHGGLPPGAVKRVRAALLHRFPVEYPLYFLFPKNIEVIGVEQGNVGSALCPLNAIEHNRAAIGCKLEIVDTGNLTLGVLQRRARGNSYQINLIEGRQGRR